MFLPRLPNIHDVNIEDSGSGTFILIFRMLSNLLNREFPFGQIRRAVTSFKEREIPIVT